MPRSEQELRAALEAAERKAGQYECMWEKAANSVLDHRATLVRVRHLLASGGGMTYEAFVESLRAVLDGEGVGRAARDDGLVRAYDALARVRKWLRINEKQIPANAPPELAEWVRGFNFCREGVTRCLEGEGKGVTRAEFYRLLHGEGSLSTTRCTCNENNSVCPLHGPGEGERPKFYGHDHPIDEPDFPDGEGED